MEELSDEIIMSRVKDGNLYEISKLFERYHIKLYNFFLRLTFDKTTSQDLTQNLFYRVIKYRQTFREKGSFRSWIYQMARNIHIDFCNQEKKFSDHIKSIDNYNENTIEPKETYNIEDFNKLDRALLKLSPEQRRIIVLSRFHGLKYDEISKIQQTSVAAIKVQVHRAIKQLRDIYFNMV